MLHDHNGLLLLSTSAFKTWFIWIVVCAILVMLVIRNIRIVPEATAFIIERLGAYRTAWPVGIHVKIPVIERVAKVVSLKEKVIDFPPQAVITKDNVSIQIDTVFFVQVTDPKQYAYGTENPILAIENLSATSLRNLIGALTLDETLADRKQISMHMLQELNSSAADWGIRINRIELKDILPPQEIQEALERQMKAEREKREKILLAEGEKEAAIRRAEGEKEAAVLKAEAARETTVREARGRAEAIVIIQEATARGLEIIKAVDADQTLIALKRLEAIGQIADSPATKIIIPSDLQSLAGLSWAPEDLKIDEGKAETR